MWRPLVRGGTLPLFKTPAAIAQLKASAQSPLELAEVISDDPRMKTVLSQRPWRVNVDRAVRWLLAPPHRPSRKACCDVVDALDLADDLALAIRDRTAVELARGDQPLAVALNILTLCVTVLGEGTPVHGNPAAAVRYLPNSAGAAARTVATRIGRKIKLIE